MQVIIYKLWSTLLTAANAQAGWMPTLVLAVPLHVSTNTNLAQAKCCSTRLENPAKTIGSVDVYALNRQCREPVVKHISCSCSLTVDCQSDFAMLKQMYKTDQGWRHLSNYVGLGKSSRTQQLRSQWSINSHDVMVSVLFNKEKQAPMCKLELRRHLVKCCRTHCSCPGLK